MINQIDNFLSHAECESLIEEAKTKLTPSTVVGVNEGNRTSEGTWMSTDLAISVKIKISNHLGVDLNRQENGLHIVRYEAGQEFKLHNDYFSPYSPDKESFKNTAINTGGQRTHTAMIYLNEEMEGGETYFKNQNIKIAPKTGKMLTWRNADDKGIYTDDSIHAGLPVTKGTKWIAVIWVRQFNYSAPSPYKTPFGFNKIEIPSPIYGEIKNHINSTNKIEELFEGKDTFIQSKSYLYPMHQPLRSKIHNELKRLHEDWVGMELIPTFVYGIREYTNQAILTPHIDRKDTHIISSILVIDYDEEWPLDIKDHYGFDHKVNIKKGEMCLYESYVCEHGRKSPYNGQYFRNMFVHYSPADLKEYYKIYGL